MKRGGGNKEIRLEHRLVLAHWFARQLGFHLPEDMLSYLKDCGEQWSEGEPHPVLATILPRRRSNWSPNIPNEVWLDYDRKIGADWRKINQARGLQNISLKYFQYLAALASEHFLVRLAQSAEALTQELNEFRQREQPPKPHWPKCEAEDLDKLALWMATGSGKTLLMHLHYRQFIRRRWFKPDNVILLTPNEELSEQHLQEMQLSGIPCFRHGEESLHSSGGWAIRILECTKLRVGKRPGAGATVGTDSFEGQNLVFADEGHRGHVGEKFIQARRALAENGFCFEYSATFGQALYAAKDADLAAEYGRAIVLDYSYKHFYNDGYGKDFRVLNLTGDPTESKIDTLMLGNLLSFCQQRIIFAESQNNPAIMLHNPAPPLLLLLGTTVSGGKRASNSDTDTDLARLLLFLHRAALDADGAMAQTAEDILRGESGIPSQNGGDAFAGRLDYLRSHCKENGQAALSSLREFVFHSTEAAPLRLAPLKNTRGELELSVGGAKPFGLAFVGVGAANNLKDLAMRRGKAEGMETFENAVGGSLFAGINQPDSSVNVLIGAKKFMEGWSSWRVSGMGLLNVGRGEGSQIIQLFGRGVRLKGKDMSLKRASATTNMQLETENQETLENLRMLETLNIFGSRADFIARFGEFLEREGISQTETLEIPIKDTDKDFFRQGLLVPNSPPPEDFTELVRVAASEKDGIRATVNLSDRTQSLESGGSLDTQTVAAGTDHEFAEEMVAALDFADLHRRLLRWRQEAKLSNLLILREELRGILQQHCKIIAPKFDQPTSIAGQRHLQDVAFAALRNYAESQQRFHRKQWETKQMQYAPLKREDNKNFPDHYLVRATPEVAKEAHSLLANCENLYRTSDLQGATALPRVYFSSHLYQPLLAERTAGGGKRDPNRHAEILSPQQLNAGERNFVNSLQQYLKQNGTPKGKYYLLRNLSRGKGIGFFMDAGFYPDFILWIKRGTKQHIVFIEPHGMLLEKTPKTNPKAELHEFLVGISRDLSTRYAKWKNIQMSAFIISQTSFEDLYKHFNLDWTEEDCRAHHILFPQDDNSHIGDILGEGE